MNNSQKKGLNEKLLSDEMENTMQTPGKEMDCKGYKAAIIENLECICDGADLKWLYKYSRLLKREKDNTEKTDGSYKRYAIRMVLDDQVTEKKARAIYFFLQGYLYG